MGQKSNLLTLRNAPKLDLQISVTKLWSSFFKFFDLLHRIFFFNGVSIFHYFFGLDTNLIFFNMIIFYHNYKISFYKIKYLKKQTYSIINCKANVFSFILKQYQNYSRNNSYMLNFKVVNFFVKKKDLIFFFTNLKIFVPSMFLRRFNFFIDFLKITSLFFNDFSVSLENYTKVIGRIFKFLSKRLHNKFLTFIKTLFRLLLFYSTNNKLMSKKLEGFKFLLAGRFQAKERSSTKLIQVGTVPIQSFCCKIDYSIVDIYTLYGVFGIKLWSYRK